MDLNPPHPQISSLFYWRSKNTIRSGETWAIRNKPPICLSSAWAPTKIGQIEGMNVACKDKSYLRNLIAVCVIPTEKLCWPCSRLCRVLDCTPAYLFHEIILLDDDSDFGNLKELVKILKFTKWERRRITRAVPAQEKSWWSWTATGSKCDVLHPLLAAIPADCAIPAGSNSLQANKYLAVQGHPSQKGGLVVL
ncbi:hypothetical protein J0S82_018920, partial [Galemys pyrenaicus]